MTLWMKTLAFLAVTFALTGAPNVVLAGCGSCGGGAAHKHKKAACVKCDHTKACTSEDCEAAAHQAACTCPKKDTKKTDGDT